MINTISIFSMLNFALSALNFDSIFHIACDITSRLLHNLENQILTTLFANNKMKYTKELLAYI